MIRNIAVSRQTTYNPQVSEISLQMSNVIHITGSQACSQEPQKRLKHKAVMEKTNKKCDVFLQNTMYRIIKPSKTNVKVNDFRLCKICYLERPFQKFMSISKSCHHLFCQECLQKHIFDRVRQGRTCKCPEQNCQIQMQKNSRIFQQLPIKAKKLFEKNDRKRRLGQNKKICPKQSCQGSIQMKIQVIDEKQVVKCEACSNLYCPRCLSLSHQNQCRAEDIFSLEKGSDFKHCSKCKIVIERIFGCNHMKCQCGHQFCYLCGQTWEEGHVCFIAPDCCASNTYLWIICQVLYLIYYFTIGYPLLLLSCLTAVILLMVISMVIGTIIGTICLLSELWDQGSKLFWIAVLLIPLTALFGALFIVGKVLNEVISKTLIRKIIYSPCITTAICITKIDDKH